MRLLERQDDGHLSPTEFFGDNIQRYAILSHTWGADNDEVTFKNLVESTGRTKTGYRKIQFCADQAAKDGLRFFWVDTCSIDKSSSAELAEAINSMFACWRLYQRHAFSTVVERRFPAEPLVYARRTLQGLIAPVSVEFFSIEGERLGDKHSMVQEIHDITGISIQALLGGALAHFSIEERMSWAERRRTKREEDAAYSLLGIFNIYMPPIYGEGRRNAFARLRKEINEQSAKDLLVLHSRIGPRDLRASKHAADCKREPFSTVPFAPDPDFVDRPEVLAWVRNKCAWPGARAALVGLGGVGKSQLAIQHAHSVRDVVPNPFVFWVHASTRARFEEAYRSIADRLELPGRANPKIDVLRLVSDWLCDESNGQWTMVLDNVDNVETFFPSRPREQASNESQLRSLAAYLPQSRNGSILITSRSKDAASRLTGGYNNIKEVEAMNEGQAQRLLRNKLQWAPDASTEEAALDLLRTLDYMPLAISQAAAYINLRARMTIQRYLREFRANSKKQESLLNWDAGDLRRDESASNSVVTTWQMSFERVRQERQSAADLLSLMSFFHPHDIPESVLRRYSKSVAKVSDEFEADDEFDEDCSLLHAYSLVAAAPGMDTFEMHALVQFCMQVWLSSFGNAERWSLEFVQLMAREFPAGNFENWTKCQQLLPHIEPLFESEPATEEARNAWAKILAKAAWYFWTKGSYELGKAIGIKAATGREIILEKNDGLTLRSDTVLAIVQWVQGNYSDAERFHRRALEGYEKELGEHHLDTLRSVNDLALVLAQLGKYEEAEKLHRRALEGREKELGKQHPITLTSMNNLALVVQAQGKLHNAEGLYRQALEGEEKELGEQHPDTLATVHNLGSVLQMQGSYEEAEKLYQRSLKGKVKELGEQHPDTLTSVNNLALVVKAQGKYKEAEKLHRRAVEGYKKEMGEQHPKTMSSVNNLMSTLKELGKYNEAERLYRRALEGYEKELGEQHPDTLVSLNNLALVVKAQGKYNEAEKLHRRALEGYEKELGEQHPKTPTTVNNLVGTLKELGEYDEAERLCRRALDKYEKELGEQHPDTLASLNNLALVVKAQGKNIEAERFHRRALEGYEKELGEQHLDTLTVLNYLASMLKELGKYNEAERLYRRALEGYEKKLGDGHPNTLKSAYLLAHLLHLQQRYAEAGELYQRACNGFENTLGSQHPTTTGCRNYFLAMQQEENKLVSN